MECSTANTSSGRGRWPCKHNTDLHFVEFSVSAWPEHLCAQSGSLDRERVQAALEQCFAESSWVSVTQGLVDTGGQTWLGVCVNHCIGW